MTFDLAAFLNILISGLIGVAATWIVAHLYWKRNEPSDRILRELKRVMPTYFHPIRYPQFYGEDSYRIEFANPAPLDTDIPHITSAVFSRREINEGDWVEVLLEIRDTGRNLENPEGITAQDHLGNTLSAEFCGLGYASISFTASGQPDDSKCCLSVTLKDTSSKESTLEIPFTLSSQGNS